MKRAIKSDEKEKDFLKNQLQDIFYAYLESNSADCQKDRQHKLYAFLEIQQKLK
jgi:hypothetical protein